jgi:hypothetical protein
LLYCKIEIARSDKTRRKHRQWILTEIKWSIKKQTRSLLGYLGSKRSQENSMEERAESSWEELVFLTWGGEPSREFNLSQSIACIVSTAQHRTPFRYLYIAQAIPCFFTKLSISKTDNFVKKFQLLNKISQKWWWWFRKSTLWKENIFSRPSVHLLRFCVFAIFEAKKPTNFSLLKLFLQFFLEIDNFFAKVVKYCSLKRAKPNEKIGKQNIKNYSLVTLVLYYLSLEERRYRHNIRRFWTWTTLYRMNTTLFTRTCTI